MFARLTKARKRLSLWEWLPIVSQAQTKRSVILTFDDGPSPETTPQVLAILKRHGALATFFFSGARAAEYPELVQAAVMDGHSVFPHGFDHVRMDGLTDEKFEEALSGAEEVLQRYRPTPSPYYVRLPYAAGHGSSTSHKRVRKWKPDSQIMHWGYSFHDWTLADECETLDDLRTQCHYAVKTALESMTFPGSVILLHEDPHDVVAPLKSRIIPILLDGLLCRMKDTNISVAAMPKQSNTRGIASVFRPVLVKA